jgi:hypothetical protein
VERPDGRRDVGWASSVGEGDAGLHFHMRAGALADVIDARLIELGEYWVADEGFASHPDPRQVVRPDRGAARSPSITGEETS